MFYFSLCVFLCIAIGSANHLGHAEDSESVKHSEPGKNWKNENHSEPGKNPDHAKNSKPAEDPEPGQESAHKEDSKWGSEPGQEPTRRDESKEDSEPGQESNPRENESEQDSESADGSKPAGDREPPRTKIKQGEIIGTYYSTYSGREIPAFYGLPYAAPPVNDLRFAAPQPPRSWDTPLKATNRSDFCVQIFLAAPVVSIGNENCLYLDVYTPEVPKDGQCSKSYEVYFYIHPSGAQITAGSIIEAYYLLDKRDVILVPINYRLGALGFMTSGDLVAPGNAGMKDQVMALKWVKENIRSFCGDPNRVTLVGASFGAISIGLHMISPLSKGLFHRAIMVSGNSYLLLSYNPDSANATRTVANQMNCPTNDSKSMIDCLRQKNALTFFDYELQYHVFFLLPLIIFSPVVEPCHEGAFLTKTPQQAIADGDLLDIPVLFVHNRYEGLLYTFFLTLPGLTEVLDLTYETNIKFMFNLVPFIRKEQYKQVGRNIKEEYFGKGLITGNEQGFKDMVTDAIFFYSWYQNSLDMAKHLKSPVYNIMSTFRGQVSTSVLLSVIQSPKNYGASHYDADLYVMFNGLNDHKNRRTKNDTEMIEFMTELYTSFGANGKPSIADKVEWHPQPKEGDVFHYLHYDDPHRMRFVKDDNFGRRKFWESQPIELFRGFPKDTCRMKNKSANKKE